MNEYFDINSNKIDPTLLDAMQNVEEQDNVKKDKRTFIKASNSKDADILYFLYNFYFIILVKNFKKAFTFLNREIILE